MPKRKSAGSGLRVSSDIGDGNVISFTSQKPPWAYLQLELVTHPSTSTPAASANAAPLDELTARTYLTSALSQFLGVTGAAIPIDILKLSSASMATEPRAASRSQPQAVGSRTSSHPNILWIRVPHADATAVIAAVSSWIGGDSSSVSRNEVAFRVTSKGGSLSALTAGDGAELFVP